MSHFAQAILAATALTSLLASPVAESQSYPTKPIQWIVPFPPGGGVDIMTRAVATKISAGLGQPIVIDNRGGAAGNIGTEAGARAAPDGYTLLSTENGIMTLNPYVYRNLPYNPIRDFQPISLFAKNIFILCVNPQRVPANNIGEFLAYARANPGKVTFASSGSGTILHVWAELLAQRAGLQLFHVPYKGAAPALQDLAGGQVDMIIIDYAASRGFLTSGKIRPLAVTTKEPHPKLPGIPTLEASGIKDYDVFGWVGLLSPAGTPRTIVNRIRNELLKAVPELSGQYAELGIMLTTSTPEEFEQTIRRDLERSGPLMKTLNIQVD